MTRGPQEPTPEQRRALNDLADVGRRLDRARSQRDELAREAIALGATWRALGEALGISAQSAHQRYAGRGDA